MLKKSLDGNWIVRGDEHPEIPAIVPGCIHTDLLRAKKIEDPYYADNEVSQMWIGETAWRYSRDFEVDESLLSNKRIELVCDGLDTLASIQINGRHVAKTDNAFRTWRFDVRRYLKLGSNSVEISFASAILYINRAQKKRHLDHSGVGHHRIDGSNQIRKSQCNFGWDWGPMCVTAGIWRAIYLEAYSQARIEDIAILQDHRTNGSVELELTCAVEQVGERELSVHFTLLYDGAVVEQRESAVVNGRVSATIRIRNPNLWWPNGLGAQSLYRVQAELVDVAGAPLDSTDRTIGLRTITLDQKPDRWGVSFSFSVNGKPFFAKGANWIPADTFVTRVGQREYSELLRSAAEANMNMLRVWGGGIYESDAFYDLCDEYGICVWQDFMFACSAYPAGDPDYLANVDGEAKDIIKRIRHHASLALWCGNNEIEQMQESLIGDGDGQMSWKEYSSLFDELLPRLVSELDPGRAYWPSSPHTPGKRRDDFNNPDSGDAHLWSVWHGREPFEWYQGCKHRFNSEFGFQSFPEPRVVRSFLPSSERNVTSYVMDLHQRSAIGNEAIIQYMLSWFRLPTQFDMTLWLSQILQGMAIKYAVEHWRRQMPRGMGTLYWQINDCWPVASWSSIDYFGNWKALHYMTRRFYAPLLVSGVEDLKKKRVNIYITNDHRSKQIGKVSWTLFHTDGRDLANGNFSADIPALKSRRVDTIDLRNEVDKFGERNLLVHIELAVDGETASDNLVTFVRPKHLTLRKPRISKRVRRDVGGAKAVFKTNVPALWVFPDIPNDPIDAPTTYSDRFFHLMPGKQKQISIRPGGRTNPEELRTKLEVSSLFDTYE